jgi:hypothetical protein
MVFFTISQSAVEGFDAYHYLGKGWGDPAVDDADAHFRPFIITADLQAVLIAPRECYLICHDNEWMMPFD